MVIFTYWHIVSIQSRDESDESFFHYNVLRWVLAAFCSYFLIIEVIQSLRSLKSKNVSDLIKMENFFDLLPNVLILVNCFYVSKITTEDPEKPSFSSTPDPENEHNQYFWKIQAFAGIAIWAKFFVFLRVFDTTAFLIHMIQEVSRQLGPFMVILVFSILGFTDAFYSMNKAYPKE